MQLVCRMVLFATLALALSGCGIEEFEMCEVYGNCAPESQACEVYGNCGGGFKACEVYGNCDSAPTEGVKDAEPKEAPRKKSSDEEAPKEDDS